MFFLVIDIFRNIHNPSNSINVLSICLLIISFSDLFRDKISCVENCIVYTGCIRNGYDSLCIHVHTYKQNVSMGFEVLENRYEMNKKIENSFFLLFDLLPWVKCSGQIFFFQFQITKKSAGSKNSYRRCMY